LWALGAPVCAAVAQIAGREEGDPLPPGVKAVWDLKKAYRAATPTRERVSINGLWRWQPAASDAEALQQREVTIPPEWRGPRIVLSTAYLNSYSAVNADGRKAGEMRYPAGEIGLTEWCRPGHPQTMSTLVMALPLKGVMLSYANTATARQVEGRVARRGLCGEVYLESTPAGPRIAGVKVETESPALRQAQFGRSHPATADSLVTLSALRVAQKRCGEAVPLSREALSIDRQFLPEGHALVATAALGLARALEACGKDGKRSRWRAKRCAFARN